MFYLKAVDKMLVESIRRGGVVREEIIIRNSDVGAQL
jgi:hypothetical protein